MDHASIAALVEIASQILDSWIISNVIIIILTLFTSARRANFHIDVGGKAEQQKSVVRDDVGVVDQVLLATPHDLHLAATLRWTPPHVDRPVLLLVDDGDSREGLGVELVTALGLLHAGGGGVDVATGPVHHEEEDGCLEPLGLLPGRSWRIAQGVGWYLGGDGSIDLLGGVQTVLSSQDAQEVKVWQPTLLKMWRFRSRRDWAKTLPDIPPQICSPQFGQTPHP